MLKDAQKERHSETLVNINAWPSSSSLMNCRRLHSLHIPSIKPSPARGAAFVCIALVIYTLFLYLPSLPCWSSTSCFIPIPRKPTIINRLQPVHTLTDSRHIVFGIASTASVWMSRQDYVKLWWQPPAGAARRRGFVWLDQPMTNLSANSSLLPDVKISGNTDRFPYTWEDNGSPSAIRISRIVSETFRLGLQDVRWFVMGDDDTIFFPENLAAVLRKYNHKKLYYIGQSTESQKQSAQHSFGMAYGGGGIAISYALAEALEKMQDGCLMRYGHLYGSDSRIGACAAELGVPLTREHGFHQIDMHGDIFGLLAAHPVKPLVSLHHINEIEPIFPDMTRLQALQHLVDGAVSDPIGTLQQSICYDRRRNATVSVSWGYAVQIFEGAWTPLEVQKPSTTFVDWRTWQTWEESFTFDVRQVPEDECARPAVYFMENVTEAGDGKTSIGVYKLRQQQEKKVQEGAPPSASRRSCRRSIEDNTVLVHKQQQSASWLTAPRRQACEVMPPKVPSQSGVQPLVVHVRDFKNNEIIAPHE